MTIEFKDCVAIVTGAGGGLGRQHALALVASSLSDLGIVGCKSTAAGYFWLRRSARTPLSYPISRYWAAKSSKTSRRWGRFSLSTT